MDGQNSAENSSEQRVDPAATSPLTSASARDPATTGGEGISGDVGAVNDSASNATANSQTGADNFQQQAPTSADAQSASQNQPGQATNSSPDGSDNPASETADRTPADEPGAHATTKDSAADADRSHRGRSRRRRRRPPHLPSWEDAMATLSNLVPGEALGTISSKTASSLRATLHTYLTHLENRNPSSASTTGPNLNALIEKAHTDPTIVDLIEPMLADEQIDELEEWFSRDEESPASESENDNKTDR